MRKSARVQRAYEGCYFMLVEVYVPLMKDLNKLNELKLMVSLDLPYRLVDKTVLSYFLKKGKKMNMHIYARVIFNDRTCIIFVNRNISYVRACTYM